MNATLTPAPLLTQKVKQLVTDRRNGHDCDDDGSAIVKQFLRVASDDGLRADVETVFPVEAGEVHDEADRDGW